ncbi:unnamed protein product [Aphanomyces euteiches]|uniref:Uncharacterized protein n=1 Tax=Aphanomyces euteiches TaxID=100861 RepID=A0A6G0W5Q7_9STRA|nr:hypothetical protein Ae201684_019155 [Aphanomyces euteiches]KAH9095298.1 hypothetical protein Ae201684P_013414 [Aphanomyces euteiches]KAH9134032.1 hypothetical protein AeRB84_020084 [Aphanomyces euteiches]
MARSSLLLCLLVALTSFVCVESRAMFHDAILEKVYAQVLVKDSEGKCKKEVMKHKVNQIATNCAAVSAAVGLGLACSGHSQGAAIAGGVATTIATFKAQVDSYIDERCARLEKAASGVAKVKKVLPKLKAVNAFNSLKKQPPPAEIRVPERAHLRRHHRLQGYQ